MTAGGGAFGEVPADTAHAMRRNVRLYPWFAAATGFSPWLPVFFLFFSDRVGFDGALALSAIYYVSVVILEVPSGYASDRFGRRPTLIVSAVSFLVAYAGFALADSFVALGACQALLAAGMACRSGSDSALLHDSLVALGEPDRYGDEEARAGTVQMTATGLSCLAGGALGALSLVWPYALAAAVAAAGVALAVALAEPPIEEANAGPALDQVRRVGVALADPVLAWLLVWYVVAFALAHVPFEFYQPWLRLLGESEGGAWLAAGAKTPLVSGVVFALSMFGGAVGAFLSMRIGRRLGLPRLLLLANLVQVGIVAGLAWALHPALLALVLCRNFAMATTTPPTLAVTLPRLGAGQRATWLSLQSLAGRLAFSLVLFALAAAVGDTLDWETLRAVLLGAAAVGTALALVLWRVGARTGADTGARPEPVARDAGP